MGLPAHLEVFPAHARSVIHHANAGKAARLQKYVNRSGSRIDGVVQQLADNGLRPVYDLAGRYLSGYLVPEDPDPPGTKLGVAHPAYNWIDVVIETEVAMSGRVFPGE